MTFTYSFVPGSSNRDRMRFELGDTDEDDPLLQDEELDWIIDISANLIEAKGRASEAISMKFHKESETKVGQIRLGLEARAVRYDKLAQRFRSESAQAHSPTLGGMSILTKGLYRGDTDVPAPAFSMTLHDYPGGDRDSDSLTS